MIAIFFIFFPFKGFTMQKYILSSRQQGGISRKVDRENPIVSDRSPKVIL
jgi:hypothetical protein